MSEPINLITLPLPFGMGSVNCYVLKAGNGYVLIDSGAPNARDLLGRELERLGCRPGALNLIILTHGDFDHIGNAAHVRTAFGSRIAMHADDARVAELGDMFVNRTKSNLIIRALIPRLIGFGKSERFTPDVLIEEGSSLSKYEMEAKVVWIPGHSRGSIGILTAEGDLFCGDLFENTKKPAINSLIDDRDTAIHSAARLSALPIRMVYPGHGKPFAMDQLAEGGPAAT